MDSGAEYSGGEEEGSERLSLVQSESLDLGVSDVAISESECPGEAAANSQQAEEAGLRGWAVLASRARLVHPREMGFRVWLTEMLAHRSESRDPGRWVGGWHLAPPDVGTFGETHARWSEAPSSGPEPDLSPMRVFSSVSAASLELS